MNYEEARSQLEDLLQSAKQQHHIDSTVEANQEIITGTESAYTPPSPPPKKSVFGCVTLEHPLEVFLYLCVLF